MLLADGRIDSLSAPLWAIVACAAALTLGTAAGGWSIARTVGRRIYHLHPVDALSSQGASAAVILGASLLGAPTSTTQVVASSVVGVGGGRRRWHHVRWEVVRQMGTAWLLTMPASAAIGALALGLWRPRREPPSLVSARHARRPRAAARPGRPDGARRGCVRGVGRRGRRRDAGGDVRALEHEADAAKGALRDALRDAFVTPLDPEDLFALSRGIDWILNHAKDAIGESEAMGCPPDAATAGMAALIAEAVSEIDAGIALLGARGADVTAPADAAVKAERRLEKAYRAALAALADVENLRVVMGRQELYRRCLRMGEAAVDVAERLIYAGLKEN